MKRAIYRREGEDPSLGSRRRVAGGATETSAAGCERSPERWSCEDDAAQQFSHRASQGETPMAEPTLERGSEGLDVKDLQEALIALAFKPGEVDGVFGVLTESAVKSFQSWATVMADGVVGPTTWEKLDDADKSDPTLRNGSRGIAVRGLERRLIAAGFGVDDVDGHFGGQTEAAVRAFQERYELPVDGVVDQQTWDRLRALDHER
jgi:peptidoglycan hydrolase-like protein with peptidoglycan-binding domain